MKIELPPSIIHKMLIESTTFREFVINNFLSKPDATNVVEFYRNEIRNLYPYHSTTEKISAIKYIRDISRDNAIVLDAFTKAGYDTFGGVLGLAAAKRFVDNI